MIDLTADSDDERASSAAAAAPAPAADADAEEAAARQRIMAFARAKAAASGSAAPQRLPQHPLQPAAAAQTGASGGAAAGRAAAAAGGASSSGFSNADLRALRDERERRRGKPEQGQGDAEPDAAAAAEPGAGGSGSGKRRRSRSRSRSPPRGGSRARAAASSAAAAAAASSQAAPAAAAAAAAAGGSVPPISLLTYNVWFREDVAVIERMMAIGDAITAAGHPTFVCLQEVTPLILSLFQQMPWWQHYVCCRPPHDAPYFTLLLTNAAAAPGLSSTQFREAAFNNSCMGRSLRTISLQLGGARLVVGTSHLESPIPPTRWYSQERQAQLKASLRELDGAGAPNVLWAGDANWTDSRDGPPPLPPGWHDAWLQLQPGAPGFTYDPHNNPMLAHKQPGLRLDRIFCKLADWRLASIEQLGRTALPGVLHTHTYKSSGKQRELPVLPSDHFGLLLRLEPV